MSRRWSHHGDDRTVHQVFDAYRAPRAQEGVEGKNPKEIGRAVGLKVAEAAKAAGIASVVFDRNGYRYHGRVKALADGAREGGLTF